jgi:hypothetical protein
VTTELIETTTSKTDLVDEFLDKHGVSLPGHIVDFALDARAVIAELELMIERVPASV